MLGLVVAYFIGKRVQKNQNQQPVEIEMTDYEDWRGDGQDSRSLEQLLKEARENHANKNYQ